MSRDRSEYHKTYNRRPEVVARRKAYFALYNKRPGVNLRKNLNRKKNGYRSHRRDIETISDNYCRNLLYAQNGGKARCGELTKEMIESKRLQIQLKRKLYEISKQQSQSSGNHGRADSMFQRVNLDRGDTQKYAHNY